MLVADRQMLMALRPWWIHMLEIQLTIIAQS